MKCHDGVAGDPNSHTTEDPLSPPCVAWDPNGGNSGATSQGVSADHIDVVLVDNDANQSGQWDDYINGRTSTCPSDQTFPYCSKEARTFHTLRQFFQTQFQTYGRVVRFHVFKPKATSGPGFGTISGKALADAVLADARNNGFVPFAVVGGSDGRAVHAFADDGVIYFDVPLPTTMRGTYYWQSSLDYEARSGACSGSHCYWSFLPSIDNVLDNGASWICRSVANRPPTETTDATIKLLGGPRKIVLGYNDQPDMETQGSDSTSAVKGVIARFAQMTDQMCGCPSDARCRYGGHVFDMTDSPFMIESASSSLPGSPGDSVTKLRAAGVTSVLCVFCSGTTLPDQWSAAQSQAQYFPEFMLLAGNNTDPYMARARNQSTFNGTVGITEFWQLAGYPQTYWARAYRTVDPTSFISVVSGFSMYELCMQLFSAVQLAGPNLKPSSVESGMVARWQRAFVAGDTLGLVSASPAAGYGPADRSFLKGMEEERWDAAGIPPEGPYPTLLYHSGGCYRIIDHQRRFTRDGKPALKLDPWFDADHSAENVTQAPCTADASGDYLTP